MDKPLLIVTSVVVALCSLLLVALLMFYGHPVWGKVVERDFVPAHDVTTLHTTCYPIGKIQHCSTVPIVTHEPDTWNIRVCRQLHKWWRADCVWTTVSQQVYNEYTPGRNYDEREVTHGN